MGLWALSLDRYWHQVIFLDESTFHLWDHDDCIRVWSYAGQRCFPKCVIERILAEHPELWSGVRFRIMEDPICYEMRIISITAGLSVKCYSPKSFPSFKASHKLFFSKIMHECVMQRLFEASIQPNACNFFLHLLIRQTCHVFSMCVIMLVVFSFMICILQLQKTNFGCAD